MSNKVGRPSKYESLIEPRLDEIKEWSKAGATNKEMASALGVHVSTFCEYLNKYPEFKDSVNEHRQRGIAEVKNALFKKACGFEYTEVKTYLKKDVETGKEYKYREEVKKQALPDTCAIAMYLRNYSDDFNDSDKFTQKFKEMELELKKELAESQNW